MNNYLYTTDNTTPYQRIPQKGYRTTRNKLKALLLFMVLTLIYINAGLQYQSLLQSFSRTQEQARQPFHKIENVPEWKLTIINQ